MPRRIVFTGKQQLSIEEFKMPSPASEEVVVRVKYTLVSTGTETIVFNRRFDAGTYTEAWVKYPFYPGYAAMGEVLRVGDAVKQFKAGDRVVCRGNHASVCVRNHTEVWPVPNDVDDRVAPWFALAKITAMGARVAKYRLGASVLVIGAGPIGQMSLRWAASAGVGNLIVADSIAMRLDLARKGGATSIVDKPVEKAIPEIERLNCGEKPEIVLDTTGNAAVFASALVAVARLGTVVLIGDTGTPGEQRLTQDVVIRGLHIVGAHDCHDTPDWNTSCITRLFFDLVAKGRMNMGGMNTHEFKPDAAAEVYDLASNRRAETMGIIFDWTQENF